MMVSIALVGFLCLLNGELAVSLHLIDVLKIEGKIEDLFRGQVVRIHRVVTVVHIEGGHANGRVVMVIVGKLSCVEKLDSIVLAVRGEHAEISFKPLVV